MDFDSVSCRPDGYELPSRRISVAFAGPVNGSFRAGPVGFNPIADACTRDGDRTAVCHAHAFPYDHGDGYPLRIGR